MHRPTTTSAVVALALTVAAACSSEPATADSFCEDVAEVQDELLAADAPDSEEILDTLDDARPPDEIADAYDNVLNIYEDIGADQDALTDPSAATRIADFDDDIATVEDYLRDHCGPDK